MNQENQQAPFSIEELNGAWHELIDAYLMNNLTLSKKVKALESETTDLRAKLHKAELALLAAEGKQVIDG